ncbi:glycosyltransferase [Erwinia sp. CPCC 100877]|nr:glycosyltransferase [Erwinia sp. CPCC 100877]
MNNKTNLLFVIPSMENAGPVNVCLNIIENLGSGFNVTVITFRNGENRKRFENSAKVIIVKWYEFTRVVRLINASEIDIVHSHCLLPDMYNFFASLFFRKKRITTVHNYIDVDYVYSKGFWKGKIMGWINRLAIKKMIKVACSESVATYCNDNYSFNDMLYISNGVDRDSDNISLLKREKKTVDFFYLGVVNRRKNIGQLLRVFSLWSNGKDCFLHIIGDGPDLDFYHKKYSCNNIIFHGRKKKPYEVFENYDCFVSCSLAEGLPLAMIESISYAKPYICSSISPHKEIDSKVEGVSGFIFDCTDVGLSEAFDKFYLCSNRNEMSKNAITLYENNYTAQHMVKEYKNVYSNGWEI